MKHIALNYSTFIDDSADIENTRDKTNISNTTGGLGFHQFPGIFSSFLNEEAFNVKLEAAGAKRGQHQEIFHTTQLCDTRNHSMIEKRGEGPRDLSQSENLGYVNSSGYKFKAVMIKLLKMKFNVNICKKILAQAPWELSEDAILTHVIEEVLKFQEKFPVSNSAEDLPHFNRSNIISLTSTRLDALKDVLSARQTTESTRGTIKSKKQPECPKERASAQAQTQPAKSGAERKAEKDVKAKGKSVIKVSNRGSKLDRTIDMEANQTQILDLDQLRKKNPEAIIACNICFEEFPIFQRSAFVEVPSCRHSFCNSCVFNYLQTLIMSSNVLEIRCPEFECSKILSEKEVHYLLRNEELFSKYQKFKRNSKLRLDSTVRWCIRPGCELFTHGSPGFSSKITCKCGQEMCYECRGEWHQGLSCEEAVEKELGKYAEDAEVQNCPKCFTKIEKNGGCNHILCTQCLYEFCWLCGKQYKPNHYSWWNLSGCPGRQFIDSELNLSPLTVLKLWWTDFFNQMRDIFSIFLLGLLLIVVGPFVYLFICLCAPLSVFNNVYDTGDSGCFIRVLINIGLLLLGILILPLTILFGLWVILKRLLRREEINFFMLFYDEFVG